jgi:hypothetical protein
MRIITIILSLLFLSSNNIYSQMQLVYTSSAIPVSKGSGWINFDKDGEGWQKRLYTIDSTKFEIMGAGYSSTVEYSYTFNQNEIAAGIQIYSLGADINGSGRTDFYILSYANFVQPYRQTFKIFDIATGEIIFQKNDPLFYFSYPVLTDINNNGFLECIVTKINYPFFNQYFYEIYSISTTGANPAPEKLSFQLNQNYPNPFNPSTKISFTLETPQPYSLNIYDVKGELIRSISNFEGRSGNIEIEWDGTNNNGAFQPTGVYFYELRAGEVREAKKMLLLK